MAARINPPTKEELTSKTYADYVCALNDKSKLENENKLLLLTLGEETKKLHKMREKMIEYKEKNELNEWRSNDFEKEMTKNQNYYKYEKERHEKSIATHKNIVHLLQLEIDALKKEVYKCTTKMNRLANDLKSNINKRKEYKEKLKSLVNVLSSLIGNKSDKESQTMIGTECDNYDDSHLISELFFKQLQ